MSNFKNKNRSLFLTIVVIAFLFPGLLPAQEWDSLATLPDPRSNMSSAVLDDTLYIIGGKVQSTDGTYVSREVLCYDMTNQTWLPPAPSLNFPRYDATAVAFLGNIVIFGGSYDEESYHGTIELWNPSMDEWEIIGELDPPRAGLRASVINDVIYLSGGISYPFERHSQIYSVNLVHDGQNYSVDVDLFIDTLPTARSYHTMEVVNDRMFIFGGYSIWPLNDAYMHITNGWLTLDPMPSALSGMGSTIFHVMDQPLIVLSGGRNETTESSNIRYFHANNLEWSDDFPLINDLPIARSGHIMESFGYGIYVAGGSYRNTLGENIFLDDFIVFFHDPTSLEPKHISVPEKELTVHTSPNPSNGEITITLDMNTRERVDVKIFNVLGQPVANWILNPTQGKTNLSWNGRGFNGHEVSAGIYFLVALQGQTQQTRKLIRLP